MIFAETSRLILRAVELGDAEELMAIFADPEVMRFGPGVQTLESVRDWIKAALKSYQDLRYGPYMVIRKADHCVLGYCGLFYFPDINGSPEVEIGYRLAQAHWGQGYASEAASAVRDAAFRTFGFERLIAMCDPGNTASIRVAEKLGMHYENEVMFEGFSHPDKVYVIERPAGG